MHDNDVKHIGKRNKKTHWQQGIVLDAKMHFNMFK